MHDAFSVPVYSGSSLPEGYQPAWRLRLSPSSPLPPWAPIRLFRLSYQCSLSVYFELTPPRTGFLRLSDSLSLPFHRPSVYSPELCQYLGGEDHANRRRCLLRSVEDPLKTLIPPTLPMNPNAELICPDQPSSTIEILRKLGSGDFGTVYVGRVGNVERALKVVRRLPLSSPFFLSCFPRLIIRICSSMMAGPIARSVAHTTSAERLKRSTAGFHLIEAPFRPSTYPFPKTPLVS